MKYRLFDYNVDEFTMVWIKTHWEYVETDDKNTPLPYGDEGFAWIEIEEDDKDD